MTERDWQTDLRRAIGLHEAGELIAAQSICDAIITGNPNNAWALHLRGVLAAQAGEFAEAETFVRRALDVTPASFEFHNSLGNVLRAVGRIEEALSAYRAALRLQPNVAYYHHNLGLALQQQHRSDEAEAAFREAIRLSEHFVPARIELAHLLAHAGRFLEAETCIIKVVALAPDNVAALTALGLALAGQGKHESALNVFDEALAVAPANIDAVSGKAASLASLAQYEAAVACFEVALGLAPDSRPVRLGLALALLDLARGDSAEEILRPALQACPADPKLLAAMGRSLVHQDRLPDALRYFEQAAKWAPEIAEHWNCTGMTLRDLGRWPEALTAFKTAAQLAPIDAAVQTNHGCALLASGDFVAGWQRYEWRLERPGNIRLPAPRWDGKPTDKVVLIYAEQGIGDTLQFARFVPEAARRARVLLGCPPPWNATLSPLLRTLPCDVEIVSGDTVPPYSLQCPLLSLAMVLDIEPHRFSDAVPYLHADATKRRVWRKRLANLSGTRVGVAWAGNPAFPYDRRRSLPPAQLSPLLEKPGISWISLQTGGTMPNGFAFDAAPWLHDFAETAAVIEALDLVIAVDTAVAHLAGALGRPVWLLNRADTDWRWLLGRADSPWYPTMRIFRQPRPGAWDEVIEAVAVALAEREIAK